MGIPMIKEHNTEIYAPFTQSNAKMINDATGVAFITFNKGLKNSWMKGMRQPQKASTEPVSSANKSRP